MMNLREYKKVPDQLSDLLSWAALVAPGVVLNKDGSLQTTIRYRGPDLDSATEAELIAISARLNNIVKRLGSGWALFAEAQRQLTSEYPQSTWPNAISALIDQERKELIEGQRHFESCYYLTLVYLPPAEISSRIKNTFVDSSNTEGNNYNRLLSSFQAEIERITGLMDTLFSEVAILNNEETLTYLHGLVSDKRHNVVVPENPMYLDALLTDCLLYTSPSPRD